MKHPVTTSANGKQVYVNLIQSDIAARISREPHLLTLAREILNEKNLNKSIEEIQADLGRVVGMQDVVSTVEGDAVFFAKLNKSPHFRRFVKHKKTEEVTTLSITLLKDEKDDYEITNLHIGTYVPPELIGENDSE
jgi:hypothetical protein